MGDPPFNRYVAGKGEIPGRGKQKLALVLACELIVVGESFNAS